MVLLKIAGAIRRVALLSNISARLVLLIPSSVPNFTHF